MTRDEKGRFRKGVSGNPGGRSRNEAATTLRDALATALTPEKATAIAEKMITQAERGDRQAREQLLRFLGLFDDKIDNKHTGELIIRYVNDWRNIAANSTPRPTSGT